jgi:hypothetical protein
MSEDVRRCSRKLVMGVACLCLLDLAMGNVSRALFFSQRSGKFYRLNKAMASANERLVVFGSSHAASHYVPAVLEQELGKSCFNAGVLGQQILFHKTLESILLQRVTPDLIILDVDPSTLYESGDAYDRLAELRPFWFRYPGIIGPVLDHRSCLERFFLQSKLYQYNSTIVHVIRYAVAPQPDSNGYRPDYGVMVAPTVEEERDEAAAVQRFRSNRKLDPVMVDAMERFATDAIRKNVRVFYFVSPGAIPYDLESNASYRRIESIASQAHVPFFNFRNHPDFLRQYVLFADSGHLNDAGARRYSRLVAETIKDRLALGTL